VCAWSDVRIGFGRHILVVNKNFFILHEFFYIKLAILCGLILRTALEENPLVRFARFNLTNDCELSRQRKTQTFKPARNSICP
jgi:hypothetical protein